MATASGTATDARMNVTRLGFLLLVGYGGIACGTEAPKVRVDVPRDRYPAGPFAFAEGDTIEDLSFDAADGKLSLMDVRSDKQAELLLLVTAAEWCTACIEEQPDLQALFDQHETAGLRVVVSLFEDSEFAPATEQNAAEWREGHALSFPVVADPAFLLSRYYDTSLTPMNMLVDLDSMVIERVTTGFDRSVIEALVEALL